MIRTELPIPRALGALQGAVRKHGAADAEALTFALTWMAAAKMVLKGQVPGLDTTEDLATEAGWNAIEKAGLPLHGTKRWSGVELLEKASVVINELVSDLGQQAWDVLPAMTSAAISNRYSGDGMPNVAVADLMLDLLGTPAADLWIPFDRWGVLTIRALRRGWHVNAAQMQAVSEPTLPLLLAIEYGQLAVSTVNDAVVRDGEGRPMTKAAYVLAMPPFGVPVRDTRLAQWNSDAGDALTRYARSETWATHELVNRTSKKAVFLLPPGVLFTRGQEQRLREYLLDRGDEVNELQSVVALPSGAISNSNLASALLVITPGQDNSDVLMVDLGLSRRSAVNIDELVRTHREIALGHVQDSEHACRVSRYDIKQTELSFAPSRYLHKTVEVGPNAVALENLCELLRAPTMARDDKTVELSELGIPELGRWATVEGDLEKKVRMRDRRDLPTLKQGDLVLSVKGTVGKAALVGAIAPNSAVVSQACLGLRLLPGQQGRVSPEYLLMYLRSQAGQAQLSSLQAGATIAHISPQTLLTSFLVPMPEAQERASVESSYRSLCEMEHQVDEIEKQMENLAASRWVA